MPVVKHNCNSRNSFTLSSVGLVISDFRQSHEELNAKDYDYFINNEGNTGGLDPKRKKEKINTLAVTFYSDFSLQLLIFYSSVHYCSSMMTTAKISAFIPCLLLEDPNSLMV